MLKKLIQMTTRVGNFWSDIRFWWPLVSGSCPFERESIVASLSFKWQEPLTNGHLFKSYACFWLIYWLNEQIRMELSRFKSVNYFGTKWLYFGWVSSQLKSNWVGFILMVEKICERKNLVLPKKFYHWRVSNLTI